MEEEIELTTLHSWQLIIKFVINEFWIITLILISNYIINNWTKPYSLMSLSHNKNKDKKRNRNMWKKILTGIRKSKEIK